MSDTNERSVASAGSVAGGVVQQLRDSFAAAALTGLLSSLPNGDQYHSFAVERAWSLADSMLCERGKNNTPNDAVPAADGGGSLHQEGSRVRASATPTGNTQGVLVGGWRTGKPTPQPTLTDAEREAVEWFAQFGGDIHADAAAATLRGLLDRLK